MTPNRVLQGLLLIQKYTPEEFDKHLIQAEHDQVWCCSYSGDEMTPEEREKMDTWGWYEKDESWSFFT